VRSSSSVILRYPNQPCQRSPVPRMRSPSACADLRSIGPRNAHSLRHFSNLERLESWQNLLDVAFLSQPSRETGLCLRSAHLIAAQLISVRIVRPFVARGRALSEMGGFGVGWSEWRGCVRCLARITVRSTWSPCYLPHLPAVPCGLGKSYCTTRVSGTECFKTVDPEVKVPVTVRL